ncbi:unnamed protein product [Durusdinium trenchii]|uniref:Uncharacterized protein n=2 Tax=Durusdinium trenchii TaxID=1381693 RepID=A0ABP0LBT1_9DINO
MIGLILQLASQLTECSKNLIGEAVMGGAGLKLDVLTFVLFQAPFSLLFLAVGVFCSWTPDVVSDFKKHWHWLIVNACIAFLLNVLIAVTLKKLSALAFVIIGVVKDMVIVSSSSLVFGDPISRAQEVGFAVTITGVLLWSRLKLQEQAARPKRRWDFPPLVTKQNWQESKMPMASYGLLCLILSFGCLFNNTSPALAASFCTWFCAFHT